MPANPMRIVAVTCLLLSLTGCAETAPTEDANVALPDEVTIEQQLAVLADIGITINDGVTIDDVTAFEDRERLESQPYSGLIEVLGYEIEREPFTPKCNQLWMCDYERIEDHGDYRLS